MKKIIVIAGVLLTTSCGMFSKVTEQEKELNYQIDKAYLEYSQKRDSLILEYYRK
jgi:protein-S-isoprenylcysteine O-methyltransferase Ste14